jgi:L-alanine-DL-glutamate epimerase-like enolase superfamily enzyme
VKIIDIKTVLLSAPTGGLDWIGGRLETWDTALIQVITDEGIYGLGEVTQAATAAGAVPGIAEMLKPVLIGLDPRRPRQVQHVAYNTSLFWARGGICSGVISAIEIACWDIAGKAAGVPVCNLLGGPVRDSLPVYASAGLGKTVQDVVASVVASQKAGFKYVKVRALHNPRITLDMLDAVQDALEPGVRMMLDAVQSLTFTPWSFKEALEVGKKLGRMNAVFYEEPVRAEDIEGYVELRRRLDVPIAGVETFHSPHEFQKLIAAGGIDIAQPDATIVGGIGALHTVASIAQIAGVRTTPHTWGAAGTVQANHHAAFSHPNVPMVEFSTYHNPLVNALLVDGSYPIHDGQVQAPTQPGLGIHLTGEVIAKYSNYRPGEGIFTSR